MKTSASPFPRSPCFGDNWYRFVPDRDEVLQVILALASGVVDEPDLAR